MSLSAAELGLLRAVLQQSCGSDLVAAAHLARAEALGVDPLDYCSRRFGLGDVVVWARAADWAGFAHFNRIPAASIEAQAIVPNLDRLGEVRSVRLPVLDREVVFIAPRFAQVVNLRRAAPDPTGLRCRLCFVPPREVSAALALMAADELTDNARQRIALRWNGASASVDVPIAARLGFVAMLALIVGLVAAATVTGNPLALPFAALLLMLPGLLRFAAAIQKPPPAPAGAPLADADLPVYSVMVPLRDEAHMVPGLVRAIAALDYPPEKLDVLFVVEATSTTTLAAVRLHLDDPRFTLVAVPDSQPRTKPKALNYALPFARGAHLVVYDAEDVPEPGQLREAARRFAADPQLACLQAELVADNAEESWLAALFAGEYAGLFGRFLPALAAWGLPVPLGGTSNHFRTETLRAIGGWDAFNVTEDADLGVRLARRRLRTATFTSRTGEEAPVAVGAWLAQRTRWIKGWMQTFIVHNRAPRRFLREVGWRAFLGFELLVGSMILSSLLHTIVVSALAVRLALHGFGAVVPTDGLGWTAAIILLSGYGGALALVVAGLAHIGALRLLPMQLLLPAYWALHSLAAIRAAIELVRRPHFWSKTTHGVAIARHPASASRNPKVADSVPAQAE